MNTFRRSDRSSFFEYLNREIIRNEQIEYLEFGVFEGDSILEWTRLNANPHSRFYGFDTFTGLPEDWGSIQEGTFNVGGAIPDVDDHRATFISGLFQDSLCPFINEFTPVGRLVVNLDADLYSSTLYCLVKLDAFIERGSVLIFDEFWDLQHEYAAFDDYIRSHKRTYRPLGMTEGFQRFAVEIC